MYKFEKINEDTYKLITNNEEFTFTRTVDLAKELQKVDMYTTMYMADLLAERGETFENTKLKTETRENGKTIVDETNFNVLKEQARNIATFDVMNSIFNKIFKKPYLDILKNIDIKETDKEGISQFTSKLADILVNGMIEDTPREQTEERN